MKVFCIGFHKTGTSSLGKALEDLGFRVCGPVEVHNPAISHSALDIVRPYLERFDAFQDNPWPLFYRELDLAFPGSRFIHTIRDADDWFASAERHFGTNTTPMRRWIYGQGAPVGNRDAYVGRYRQHNREVSTYFAKRRDDYLRIDLCKGAGWPEVCEFLNAPQPDTPFPWIRPQSAEGTASESPKSV